MNGMEYKLYKGQVTLELPNVNSSHQAQPSSIIYWFKQIVPN